MSRQTRMLSPAEQWEQAARCGCRGSDDYCRCQNVPDDITKRKWRAEAVVSVLMEVVKCSPDHLSG